MLRTLLLLIALIVVIGIALVATGVVNLTRNENGFTVGTEPLSVETKARNMQVPVIRMETQQVQVPEVTVGNQANGQ